MSIEDFKGYVLLRRDAFEEKYNLIKLDRKPLRQKHLCNNLKYLDDMSQIMIRTLNNHPVPLRDKLLTVLVYRLVGDKNLVRRYANSQGVFTIQGVELLAKRLDKKIGYPVVRYNTPVFKTGTHGLTSGEYLLAVTCSFLDNMPKDMYRGYRMSEIVKSLREWDKVYGISTFFAYELASDFSYINELNIKIDYVSRTPNPIHRIYEQVTGEKYSQKGYKAFTEEIMDWYTEQDFHDNKERLILPHDVTHMLYGYNNYLKKRSTGVQLWRKPARGKKQIKGIVIARSMYDYYTKKKV